MYEAEYRTVSEVPSVPWGTLPLRVRIRVRHEIQEACKMGGLSRHHLAFQISQVLYDGDLRLDRLKIEAWDFNVRRCSGAWGGFFREESNSIRSDVARTEKLANDIIDWLLEKELLRDQGSDGIVICAGSPLERGSR